MRGAIPPLPTTPSWRGASLSTGTTLSLPLRTLELVSKILEMSVCVHIYYFKQIGAEISRVELSLHKV
jgi:hypothetical protein